MSLNRILISSVLCLLFICCSLAAVYAKEGRTCHICGMDISAQSKSRMTIVYEDGSTVELCSVRCASEEMKQNSGNRIRSIMVADYTTEEMVDAKTATWVIGGSKPGVMTPVAKWAFAKKEDADKFISENGGQSAAFDEVIKAASMEIADSGNNGHAHHAHGGHNMDHMGPGAQMTFNPAFGDDIYHTHPAGMWMLNYRFMHVNMNGLRAGTTDIDSGNVGFNRNKPYNYMMIPTSMSMDMHMFMLMYGITDRITAMVMANYQVNVMNMLMDMGPGKMVGSEPPMQTHGFGDMELRGIYKINNYLSGSLGVSIPTGSTRETFITMRKSFRAPYDMQLGSGTFDLKPAITYSALSADAKWNWGAQAMYTAHLGRNDGWSYGDTFKATSWIQRALGPVSVWLRLAFTDTGRIRGADPQINLINHPVTGMGAPMPDADPNNYGGQRLDGLIGMSLTKGPVSIGIEGGLPIYQSLNGLQLQTSWLLTIGGQVMF